MKKLFSLSTAGFLLLGLSFGLSACKRVVEATPEELESFAVSFDFAPTVLSAAGCGSSNPDTCLTAPGTVEQPLDYAHSVYVDVFLNIEAIGSKGTKPFPWDGEVGVRLARGRLHTQMDRVLLVDGQVRAARVRLQHVAGPAVIFIEDRMTGVNDVAPTFAVGASPRLYFAQPSIAQVQESRDEGEAALNMQNVEVTSGEMYVTRVSASGFNLQDLSDDRWNGIFVYTYGSVEGIVEGSRILDVGGTVAEFLGSTQISFPTYGGPYTRCQVEIGSDNAGAEDTEVDVGMTLPSGGCPPTTTCMPLQEQRGEQTVSVHRCVPQNNPEIYDPVFGRVMCTGLNDTNSCPAGMHCLGSDDPDETGFFCQVLPVPAPSQAWPSTNGSTFPYCGPYHTDNEAPLNTESYEGKLVTLSSSDGAVRFEGLPVCKYVADITSVRSTCNLTDEVSDCPLARAGDQLLRNPQGALCYRGYQACKDDGRDWNTLRSTCNSDSSLDYCYAAEPGDPVLRNDQGTICRSTMDDLLLGGYTSFNQWKATFVDDSGAMRCATIISDALTGFDPIEFQESNGQVQSLTGTLKQSRFSSGSSYWIVELRKPSDIVY